MPPKIFLNDNFLSFIDSQSVRHIFGGPNYDVVEPLSSCKPPQISTELVV